MTRSRSDDDIIMELATFYETEGLVRDDVSSEQIEERFWEFKQRLRGGVTLVELTVMVYKKFGHVL